MKKNYNKKMRLLKEFEDFLAKKTEEDPKDESHIIVDDTIPKNCILFTNHETGEQLMLKCKIENDKLEFTEITIPRKKKVVDNV